MKRVLVLGAGLVSRPLVHALSAHDDLAITLADRDGARARTILSESPRGRAIALDLLDTPAVGALVGEADLVVSLLPNTLHAAVAELAIVHRKPLITTSYVSPEMRALDASARAAGVLLLNEIGLDPGLDHMSAMRVIRRLRSAGARLVGFRSCCGGVPAPEANTNPWGYKFSWSPRGVLLAGRNPARWLEDGRVVEVDGPQLFSHATPYRIAGLPALEMYPNRDSVAYVGTYGIAGVQSMLRGTLRWPGWCETLDALAQIGLLDVGERAWRPGTTYAEFADALMSRAGVVLGEAVRERLRWVGLFAGQPIGTASASPLDVLCGLMTERLAYAPGERDLVVLRHEFGFIAEDGSAGRAASTLLAYGEPGGDSAMSRAVSLPAAAAARLVLDGAITATGVRIPVDEEIYEPVLHSLEPLGIRFEETGTFRL